MLLLVKPKQMKNLEDQRIDGNEKTETGLNELSWNVVERIYLAHDEER
jgi:hypothetical protein